MSSIQHFNTLLQRLKHNTKLYIGYPSATDFTLQNFGSLLNYSINNLGNPYDYHNPFSSHEHEVAVLNFFMNLYHTNINQTWGYIAHCSSEAILYCLWHARESLKIYQQKIIIIASEYAHYSIDKVAKILDIELVRIPSHPNGSIRMEKVKDFLDHHPNISPIFFATLGSTITSSLDDIQAFKALTKQLERVSYVHADAAFDGAFLPFIKEYKMGLDMDSINISGHKFIGSPMPSGILLIQKKYISENFIEYVRNNDVTIGGSRNGILPVLLYAQIQDIGGKNGLYERYLKCLNVANDLIHIAHEYGLNAWKNEHALTVVLDKVADPVMQKWHAPSYKNYTTITALPKLTLEKFHEFIEDIQYFNQHKRMKDSIKTEFPKYIDPL